MCIVWWSSGCPHCHRLCLVPVPVPLQLDGYQQQLNNNEPQTDRNPRFRSGPETLRAQAPAGTTCTNKTIPHATTTRTRLSWIQNPFEPETPFLEVQRIWRCYEVDTGLSARESLRSEMAGVIAWGRGVDCSSGGVSFAGLNPTSSQGKMPGTGPDGPGTGPEAGSGSGIGAGIGPGIDGSGGIGPGSTGPGLNIGGPTPATEHLGTVSLVNPYLHLNLTHASLRQSRLPNLAANPVPNNLNLPLDSPNCKSPPSVVDDSSLPAFWNLFDSESPSPPRVGSPSGPCFRFSHLDSLPSPDPHITEPDRFSEYCDVPRLFRGLWIFPGPWPSPRRFPVCVPSSSGLPDPGLLPFSAPVFDSDSPALLPMPGAVPSRSKSRSRPQQPLPNPLPPILIGSRTFPRPFCSEQQPVHHHSGHSGHLPLPQSNGPRRSMSQKGGLESFRLCPFLQHLDASDPEEKHPREECWLTRYRWMEIRKVLEPRNFGRGHGVVHLEWFRLLSFYLPIGGKGARVVMGDISG